MLDFTKYHLHDLTRTYAEEVVGYSWETAREMERDGWNARWLRLYSHAGTHMDAPRHFAVNDTGIEDYPLERLMGKAWVLRVPVTKDRALLGVELVDEIQDDFCAGDSLLLHTGWDQHLPHPRFRNGLPRISEELAHWCVEKQVKILGVEGPSVADVNDLAEVTKIHRILLGGKVIIVEGLVSLDKISASSVTLIALPLKFEAGDGSPCRVIALEAKKQAPMKFPVRDLGELMTSLPAQQSEERLDAAIQWALWDRYDLVIVLDDDPTGTQTVHNIPVLTELNEATLANELARGSKFFYLLTNSRAYPAKEVAKKTEALGKTIRAFCQSSNLKPLVIIRGDSTLRGHFDQEDLALAAGLGLSGHYPFLIPAFFEGGRYTINDVHYVQEGQQLIPAAQTPFAEDKTFGYSSSDLKEWVTEKASAIGQPTTPISISITNLRTKFPTALRDKIAGKQTDQVCIINAADYTDLKRAALAILRFAYKPLIRSSASFVAALLGQPKVPFLTFSRVSNRGALFLVGSHVPKTTAQVEHLLVNFPLAEYQIHVRSIVEDPSLYLSPAEYAEDVDRKIATGVDVVIYTSREFFAAPKGKKNLDISRLVSTFCLSIIRELKVQPSLLVTKGGITSSDVATEALGVKRAVALGQVQPGVPTWELGPESKFPGMPFIIFPGNVGQEDSLSSILQNTLI